jgi:hypothetical protein
MKKSMIKILSLAVILSFFACNDEIPQTLQGEYVGLISPSGQVLFQRVGNNQPVTAGIQISLIAAQRSSPINYTFEILSSSTAIEALHYSVSGNSGTIPANSSFGDLPINILPDNINPGEDLTLDIRLVSADVELASADPISFRFAISCPSNLAGTMDYVHSNIWCGAPDVAGTTNLVAISDNEYKFDDFVFGSWVPCYGGGGVDGTDPAISLRLVDVCNKISMQGIDQYGDTYAYEIAAVSGASLTINWSNTYGESGTVVLTRQDGASWPALSN